MSAFATPTLIPRPPLFPPLLFRPPQPQHPVPLPRHQRVRGHLNTFRDILREMEDLSDEEAEMEEIVSILVILIYKKDLQQIDAFTKNLDIRSRGFKHIVPIGRLYTQQEEKNDADDEESESEVGSVSNTNVVPSADEQEEEEGQDLDASMEDLDDQGSEEHEEDDEEGLSSPEEEEEDLDDDLPDEDEE